MASVQERRVPACAVMETSSKTTLARSSKDPSAANAEIRASDPLSHLLDTDGRDFKVPDFTIGQIRDAIPKECFERSALKGFGYVFRDILLLATTFCLFNTYATPEYVPSFPARCLLWSMYTFLQGLFATGLWVLAHECGHQAFSTNKIVNDTTGFILHSSLLVPYFSWKISHGKHHKATGHMERDMVFVPKTRAGFATHVRAAIEDLSVATEDAPIHVALYLIARQFFGWPFYLLMNHTGHDYHERQGEGRGAGKRNGPFGGVNHFSPYSPLFEGKDAKWIVLSDIGLGITAFVLYSLAQAYGWKSLVVWYFAPYLWVNHWLVAITYLQHTDPSIPHYTGATWTFTRGAAATIDRDFGFVGRHLFHGIIETHVLHHYVSNIPFYNAEKATQAIRPVMGRHYRSNTSGGMLGFLNSLWTNVKKQEQDWNATNQDEVSQRWEPPLQAHGAHGQDARISQAGCQQHVSFVARYNGAAPTDDESSKAYRNGARFHAGPESIPKVGTVQPVVASRRSRSLE